VRVKPKTIGIAAVTHKTLGYEIYAVCNAWQTDPFNIWIASGQAYP